MKYISSILLLLFVGFFQVSVLLAQKSGDVLPERWSLQDCISYALKNNLQLQTLSNNVQLSEQDLLQARSSRLPDLSFSSTQSLINYNNPGTTVNATASQTSFASNYSVNSSLILYRGGYIKNDILLRKLSILSADLGLKQAANDISLQLTQAYLNILLEKENIMAMQNLVQTAQAQYNQGKIRFDAGSIAKKDLVQLEATLATDQYNLVNTQNLLRQYTLTLKQILQLPTSLNLQVQDPDTLIVMHAIPSLQNVQNLAMQNRPEVRNAELSVQQAAIELKQAYPATRPSIVAGAALTTGFSNYQSTKYFRQIDNDFYENLGVTIAVPLFNNRINKTNIEKSKILIDQSKLALQSTKTLLAQEVEQAYINVLNAQSQFASAIIQLKATEESYRIANEQLKLGATDMVGFLLQKNLYIQALETNIQARYNLILSQAIYEFYMGNPIKY